jgi:hypothetical protein
VRLPQNTGENHLETYRPKQSHTKTWGKQRVKFMTTNWEMKTRFVGKRDKTNGKLKMDRRWLEDRRRHRRRRPPNTTRTRRVIDFGRSRDNLPLSVLDIGTVKRPLVVCIVGYAWVHELCASSFNRQLGAFNMSILKHLQK